MPPSRDVDEDEVSEEDVDFREDDDLDDGEASQKHSKKRKGATFIDDAAEEDDEEDEDEVCCTLCTHTLCLCSHATPADSACMFG